MSLAEESADVALILIVIMTCTQKRELKPVPSFHHLL